MTIQRVNYDTLISNASKKHGVNPDLIRAVIQTESSGDPSAASGTGPVGLMQVSRAVAKDYGFDPNDRLDPAKNIEMGTRYLAQNLKAFGGDTAKALLGYNQGTGGARQILNGQKPMPAEGYRYIRNPNYAPFTNVGGSNPMPQMTPHGIANPMAVLKEQQQAPNEYSAALLQRDAALAAPNQAQSLASSATPIPSQEATNAPQAPQEQDNNNWGDAALMALSTLAGRQPKSTSESKTIGVGSYGRSNYNNDTQRVLQLLGNIGAPTWLR